jgi:hypothetical protein
VSPRRGLAAAVVVGALLLAGAGCSQPEPTTAPPPPPSTIDWGRVRAALQAAQDRIRAEHAQAAAEAAQDRIRAEHAQAAAEAAQVEAEAQAQAEAAAEAAAQARRLQQQGVPNEAWNLPGQGLPSTPRRLPSPPGYGGSARPVPPYLAAPGDPNDRDHDGLACEYGCKN